MNVPGSFQPVDVDFNRSTELALLLEQTAGKAVVTFGPNFPGAGATGLANNGTTYTASVVVDGTPVAVSVVGSAAQTFATLITELNADLTTDATAALVGNQIVITSATSGSASTVVVTDTNLFSSIRGPGFAVTNIESFGGVNRYLSANRCDPALMSEIEKIMQFADVGDTAWLPAFDTVTFTGTGILPTSEAGLAAATYNLNVAVDGAAAVDVPVVVAGATDTFADLFASFQTGLAAAFPAATATLVQTDATTLTLTVTSPAGINSAVTVIDGTADGLIAAIVALAGTFTSAVGAGGGGTGSAGTGLPSGLVAALPAQPQTDGTLFYATDTKLLYRSLSGAWFVVGLFSAAPTFGEILSHVPASNGSPPLVSSGGGATFTKKATPAVTECVTTRVYWDGSAWKFFENNVTVGATVNPPELA